MPAPEFVAVFGKDAGRQILPPVFPDRTRLCQNNPPRNADIDDLDRSAACSPRHQQMAGFARHEGNGMRGLKGGTADLPRPAIHAGRKVDRDHRDGMGAGTLHKPMHLGGHIPRQSRAEDRIHNDIARLRLKMLDGERRKRRARMRQSRIPLQADRIAKRKHGDLRPCFLKRAGGYIAITAIVSRSAEHHKAQRARIKPERRRRDRLPCPLHQSIGRQAGLRGGEIHRRHFVRCQQKCIQRLYHRSIRADFAGMTMGCITLRPAADKHLHNFCAIAQGSGIND